MNLIRTALVSVIGIALGIVAAAPPADAARTYDEWLAARERLNARCDACFDRALTRFVAANGTTCDTNDPGAVKSLRRRLNVCARRSSCKRLRRSPMSTGSVAAAIGRELGCTAAETASVGEMVGDAPPVIEPEAGASFADVAAYCAPIYGDEGEHSERPPLMALPEPATVPDWCDESDAYGSIVTACGTPTVVVVSENAGSGIPDGSPAAPFSSIADAIAACAGSCHVLVAPGEYAGDLDVPACTIIEGGIDIAGGTLVPGAARPRVKGTIRASGDTILLARLDVRGDYSALDIDGDALVSDSVLRGDYEVGGTSWSKVGPRICGSHLAANYGGFSLSWSSTHLRIHGSAISACYVGVDVNWGSSDVLVTDSVIYGHAHAISSFASTDVTITDNRLGGSYAAVDIHLMGPIERAALGEEADQYPTTADTVLENNVFATPGCGVSAGSVALEACLTASDPVLGITLDGNVFE